MRRAAGATGRLAAAVAIFATVTFAAAAAWAAGPLAAAQAPGAPSAAPAGGGQESSVAIEADATEIHVGDQVTLRLTVDHPAGTSVRWPDPLALNPFEALSLEADPPQATGAGARTEAILQVTAFELGELELPSFAVEVADSSGAVTRLATAPVAIGVVTVGLDEGGDIRAVKGPLGIPRNWLLLLPWVAGAAALAGLLWWWARRRRGDAGPDEAPPAPVEPPHEIALAALHRLAVSPLLQRGQIKEYHIELSRILRAYVEGRYRVWALEMITSEVVAGLGRAGAEPQARSEFQRILEACDLVKFAKARPAPDVCRSLLAAARALVENTVPPPAPDPALDADGDDVDDGSNATEAADETAGAGAAPAPQGAAIS